jgi:hypothetical protein
VRDQVSSEYKTTGKIMVIHFTLKMEARSSSETPQQYKASQLRRPRLEYFETVCVPVNPLYSINKVKEDATLE